ncbi:PREDICTED: opsin, blue-sensitive-like [Atta cephalotes]|uniref:G-protein coupled receptors family 1 profile domain-containing protein n=1 Tax=Atta cephalotes TaxID=12957 RepID=A0A158NT71_ATTCE|nr:PREDICTED: opsin, blue-sensitive-like [Atta cephalotes]
MRLKENKGINWKRECMPERKDGERKARPSGFRQSALHFKLRNKIRAHSGGLAELEWNFPHHDGDENDKDGPQADSFLAQGFLTTCSFDYLTDDEDTRTFVITIFFWAYVLPMLLIIYFYSQLLKSIRSHEKMLRDQAKKMNVKSLVSNQNKERSVEMRIAKVAFTIFFLFVLAWTPYAVVALIGAYGNREALTPFSTMLPAIFAKTVSCIDPWIYAINHPRYRQELEKRCKWMGIREKVAEDTVSAQTEKVNAEET